MRSLRVLARGTSRNPLVMQYACLKYPIVCLLLLIAPASARAQGAGDPDAVDLKNYLQVIDTSGVYDLRPNLNIGDIDGDGFEDMAFGRSNDWRDSYGQVHLGGNHILGKALDSWFMYYPVGAGDFRKSGFKDVISTEGSTLDLNQAHGKPNFFDTVLTSRLSFRSYLPESFFEGVIDYDADGVDDALVAVDPFLASARKPNYLLLYHGMRDFDTSSSIFPSDSVILPNAYRYYGIAVGRLVSNHKPSIVVAQADTILHHERFRVGVIRNDVPLSKDSIIWISNSDSGGAEARKIYAMDITGDGVDDLLVSDGDSVFIYRGDSNFGKYPLTCANAYYVIKSPRFMDLNFILLRGFGGYMRNCGDLTGSGVPVVMITGQADNQAGGGKTSALFYCGGKALDSLYDAVYEETRFTQFTLDTLHSINTEGRIAAVFQTFQSSSRNFLLYNGTDQIPHKTNPNLVGVASHPASASSIKAFPAMANRYVKLDIETMSPAQRARVEIRSLLGNLVASRDIGIVMDRATQEFDVSALPEGTYFVTLNSTSNCLRTKFIVRH